MNTTMNTVNQIFDWNRFTATLRKEVVENWRPILFTLLGTYGLLTIIMIIGNAVAGDSIQEEVMSLQTMLPQKVVYGILTIIGPIIASMAFSKLTSKTGRINMFTSPSSTLEKYLVNGVVYVLGFIVSFFILAQLADLTRIAAMHIFGFDGYIPSAINFTDLGSKVVMGVGSDIFEGPMAVTYTWLGLLSSTGIYLLGSVMWPRLSLLKTFAAMMVIQLAIGILGIILAFVSGDALSAAKWLMDHSSGVMPFVLTLAIAQAIISWGLAWYLFKHKDVISLKWWK